MGRIRQLFLLMLFVSEFVLSNQEQLCIKEKAYIDSLLPYDTHEVGVSCSISYDEYKKTKNHISILVDMNNVLIDGMLNIKESQILEVASLNAGKLIFITPGLDNKLSEQSLCSRLSQINTNIRILDGGIQVLPVNVAPSIPLSMAASAIINGSAVLYNEELNANLPAIFTADHLKDYGLDDVVKDSSKVEVFITKASKEELKKHVEFLRQTSNNKKPIPTRYTCQ